HIRSMPRSALSWATVKAGAPKRCEEPRMCSSGPQKKRKESGSQPLEVDGVRGGSRRHARCFTGSRERLPTAISSSTWRNSPCSLDAFATCSAARLCRLCAQGHPFYRPPASARAGPLSPTFDDAIRDHGNPQLIHVPAQGCRLFWHSDRGNRSRDCGIALRKSLPRDLASFFLLNLAFHRRGAGFRIDLYRSHL